MKYDSETEVYELSNGKILTGIRPDLLTLVFVNDKTGFFDDITKEERKEIAEYMINLWKEWAK